MSSNYRSIRLLSKNTAELDRLTGLNGEVFYDKDNNSLRIYDGKVAGGRELMRTDFYNIDGIVSVAVGDTPPAASATGSLWFNSSTGGLFVYYKDGTSDQWMQPVIPGGGGGGGSSSGSSTLASLSDVNLSSLADGYVLKYNVSQNKWIPSADLTGSGSYSLPAATTAALGGVIVPAVSTSGITNTSGTIGLATASSNQLGGVKIDGVTLAFNGSGQLYYTGGGVGGYSLPTAGVGAGGTLGGVKVDGTSITISSGVISASATNYTLPASNTTTLGGVIIPLVATSGITNISGTIGLATATSNQLGGVKIDGSTITLNGSGQLVANYTNYTLPTATNTVLGGVKVDGTSITITSEVISVPAVATIGQANGVATLGSDGKLTAAQIPTSLSGAIVFKGTWNANTNNPTLADGSGTAGWQYAINVGGTINLGSGSVTYNVGDYVIYNGTIWERIPTNTVAAAGTLTGTTLNSTVVTSSLTSVGTLINLSVTNTITGSITGNAGTVTNGVVTTGSYSDPSWLTLTSGKVGLGNVTNESKATMFASPTFTGTVVLGAVGNVSITGGTTGQVLTTNGSGTLSWTTVSDGGADGNTTYGISAETVSGGVNLRLTGSDSSTDNVKLTAGSNVTLTRTSADEITIAASGTGGGATSLDGLSDVTITSPASGQILVYTDSNFVNYSSRLFHQFAYPATTALDVTNSGASAYLFNNHYSGNNPTVNATSGTTIAFNLNVSGHPFLIRTSGGVNYNTGLIHVAVDGVVSTGSTAQGKVSGTLYWQIPASVNGNYQYICSIHGSMVGVIAIASNAGYAPLDSPSFTGTTLTAGSVLFTNQDSGNTGTDTVTAPYIQASVGVYSPYFTNMFGDISIGPSGDNTGVINFQRQAVFQQTSEVLNTKTSATGPVEHDFETGAIWYHSSISTNFTANFTRVPTTNNRTIVCTLVLQQGATAYIPNAVQIGGVGQTIKWLGSASAPTGNANKVDIVRFTLIRTGSAWAQVLGSLTTYG
jgi:plastocyanin